jgi:PAS domain S-box-containing protein
MSDRSKNFLWNEILTPSSRRDGRKTGEGNKTFFENYRALAEGAAIGLFVLSADVFHWVNDFFVRQLGGESVGDFIGRSFVELIHAEDRTSAGWDIMAFLSGQVPFRLQKKGGSYIWAEAGGRFFDHEGATLWAGHLKDITSYRQRVELLEDSLKRYETILDDVDVHLSEIDLKGNITFINDAGCRMWKLPRHELMGMNYRHYMKDRDVRQYDRLYKDVYFTGVPVKNIMFEVTDREGVVRTIEKSVSLARDAKGKIYGFRMVSRDVTEQREAEKKLMEHRSRLEAIFGSVKDAIITVDPVLNVIDANKSTESICEMAVKEIAGKPFAACSMKCSQACREVLRQTLERKKAVREHRIECDHQVRPQQVVSVSSSPLIDPRGNFMGAVMVIRDVTLLRDVERELRERHQFQNLIGRNKTMQNIYSLLEDLANLDTTVLVTGESGTGKELVARALHYSGNRAFKPFTTVNCSALAESLLESELCGHVKGAFTGAVKDKQGRFAAADGGTILLDEIGDISPLIQVKLLRVLQEKEFERVGESTPRKVDVRVIACTNKDLKEKVRKGEFRQDLYYRLKVVEVALPPLRDRLEDVPLLVDHFCRVFNGRFGKEIEGISSEVLGRFMNYGWPGNVRELEHVLEHAFVLCRGGVITLEHLPAELRHLDPADGAGRRRVKAGRSPSEREEIRNALIKTGWNKAKAARLLGIGRRTIYRKIDDYQLKDESIFRDS